MSFLDGISLTSQTSSTTSTSSTTTSTESSSEIEFEDYLTLLMTELANQDPTDPVDSSSLNDDLMSYESLENEEEMIDALKSVVSAVETLQQTSDGETAQSYLGNDIVAYGSDAPLESGEAEWYYIVDEDATSVTLTVTDEDGNTVYETTGSATGDTENFVWDGTGDDGTDYTTGVYTLTVTATDSSGDDVDSDVLMTGTVSAVDLTGDDPVLFVNGVDIDVDDVQGVRNAS